MVLILQCGVSFQPFIASDPSRFCVWRTHPHGAWRIDSHVSAGGHNHVCDKRPRTCVTKNPWFYRPKTIKQMFVFVTRSVTRVVTRSVTRSVTHLGTPLATHIVLHMLSHHVSHTHLEHHLPHTLCYTCPCSSSCWSGLREFIQTDRRTYRMQLSGFLLCTHLAAAAAAAADAMLLWFSSSIAI